MRIARENTQRLQDARAPLERQRLPERGATSHRLSPRAFDHSLYSLLLAERPGPELPIPSAYPSLNGSYVCPISLEKLTPETDVLWLPVIKSPDNESWYYQSSNSQTLCLMPFRRSELVQWLKATSTQPTNPLNRDILKPNTVIMLTKANNWEQPLQVSLSQIIDDNESALLGDLAYAFFIVAMLVLIAFAHLHCESRERCRNFDPDHLSYFS